MTLLLNNSTELHCWHKTVEIVLKFGDILVHHEYLVLAESRIPLKLMLGV